MFRALLIDDEKLARQRLRTLLDNHWDAVTIVGEAANGEEALYQIDRTAPDLLFLDIQMPEMDGFQLLKHLTDPPLVIFITAYDEYALRAFEENSVDYLLKPVEPERLATALQKLQRLGLRRTNLQAALEGLLTRLPSSSLTHIQVPVGDRTLLLPTEEVRYFAADNKYTRVYTADKSYLITTSLTQLEAQLDPDQFVRVHRATLVNKAYIHAFIRPARGKLRLVLADADKTELDVGRTYRETVLNL